MNLRRFSADGAVHSLFESTVNVHDHPPHFVLYTGTVVLKSNLIINVPAGVAVHGAPKGGNHYLVSDRNPHDMYQDYGHSHWKDSLFYGKGLDNVTFKGAGSISGNGALSEGEPVNPTPAATTRVETAGIGYLLYSMDYIYILAT